MEILLNHYMMKLPIKNIIKMKNKTSALLAIIFFASSAIQAQVSAS
jgi:hypothetical protein